MEKPSQDNPPVVERLKGLGISPAYAWQIANEKRVPSIPMALMIYRRIGLAYGPIKGASPDEIDALEKLTARRAASKSEPA